MRFYIKEAREYAKLSQKQLANMLKISPSTLNGYEKGNHDPKSEILIQIAGICNVSVDYLVGCSDNPMPQIALLLSESENAHIKKYRYLDDYGQEAVDAVLDVEYGRVQAEEDAKNNIIDYEELLEFVEPVSAGTGIHMDTVGSSKSIRVISNIYTRKADYVLHVSGNSMEPKYHNGDKILVQEVPDVDIGEIGVWMIDGRGYVKQKAEGMLLSLNPEYPPIRPRDTWQQVCQGRVVGLLDPEWILDG